MALPPAVQAPAGSFLASYAQRGAYTDCYSLTVAGHVTLHDLVEAFYTTRLFKLERWVLARVLNMHSTDDQARQLALGRIDRFAAWKVEQRSDREVLLDAGQTRSWLSVEPQATPEASTHLLFGSAVVPMRKGGGMGLAFHALLGLHKLYSQLLLAAAARRVRELVRREPVTTPHS
jgi:hypothetical protein